MSTLDELIVATLKQHQPCSRALLVSQIGGKASRITVALQRLKAAGLVRSDGRTRACKWSLNDGDKTDERAH